MKTSVTATAETVRAIFLIPEDFSVTAAAMIGATEVLPDSEKTVALSFLGNLRGMVRILSLPFDFAYTEVQGLHWQRILMAERIRALDQGGEEEREAIAREKAGTKFQEFMAADGKSFVQEQLVERLHRIVSDSESLGTARELTRQGVVLMWSAFEVLSRDLFTSLLNGKPQLADQLFQHPATRKRFSVDKLDWQTLSAYAFDLSSSMGALLAQRADLDNVQSIRETFGALFPDAAEMNRSLGDDRLWFLFQKRNLI